ASWVSSVQVAVMARSGPSWRSVCWAACWLDQKSGSLVSASRRSISVCLPATSKTPPVGVDFGDKLVERWLEVFSGNRHGGRFRSRIRGGRGQAPALRLLGADWAPSGAVIALAFEVAVALLPLPAPKTLSLVARHRTAVNDLRPTRPRHGRQRLLLDI